MFTAEDLKWFHQTYDKFAGGAINFDPLISVVVHDPVVPKLFVVVDVLFVDTDVSLILVNSSSSVGLSIVIFNTQSKIKSDIWVAVLFVGIFT